MGWDWNDVDALAPAAQRQVLDQLESQAAGLERRKLPVPKEATDAIRRLRAALIRSTRAASPAAATPVRSATPRPVGRDVGDLYEPTSTAYDHGTSKVVVLLDPVTTMNDLLGQPNRHLALAAKKRWTILARNVAAEAALTPMPAGPVDVTIWHLRRRGQHRQLADVDAAAVCAKGALDGLVLAGVLTDDGPGYVHAEHLISAAYADVDGLIIELTSAAPVPELPVLTVPSPGGGGS